MKATKLFPATEAHAANVRANLSACGAVGARVRRMPNGALRIVIRSVDQRDAARDALVLSDAVDARGNFFTSPKTCYSWNGSVEVFVRFATE